MTRAASEAELASADTAIAVEAGEHAPRLATLKARGASAWKNRAEEILPEQVEIHGAAQPLVWHFDRAASRFASTGIELVYVSDSPRLKLHVAVARTCRPRARSSTAS